MKKILKSCLSAVLVVSMFFSLGTVAFAAVEDITCSHVEFVPNSDGTISAQAFVRDYTGQKRAASLVLAVYEGNTLVNAVSEAGSNAVLTTAGVETPAGTTLKAYVWQDDNKKVISEVANYSADFETVLSGLEIKVGSDVFDTDDFDEEYTKTITYPAGSGEVTIPEVTASIKDNAASVTIITDAEAKKTEITVEHGAYVERTVDTISSYTATRPSYTNSRTYTINYVAAEGETSSKEAGKIYASDVSFSNDGVSSSAGFGKTQWGKTYKYLYNKSYTLAEGETTKKVTIKTGTAVTNGVVFVVVPTNSAQSGRVISDASGNAPTEQNNLNVITGVDANGDLVYGKRSQDNFVTTSGGSIRNFVCYGLEKRDDSSNKSGSMVNGNTNIGTAFDPRDITLTKVPNDIDCTTAEYIPVYKTATNSSLEFYIRRDAKVMVYSTSNALNVTFDSDAVISTGTTLASGKYPEGNAFIGVLKSSYTDKANFNLLEAFLQYQGLEKDKDYFNYSDTIVLRKASDAAGKLGDISYTAATLPDIALVNANGELITNDPRLYEEDGTTPKSVEEIRALLFTPEPVGSEAATIVAPEDIITNLTVISGNTPVIRSFDIGTTATTDSVYRMYSNRNTYVGALLSYSGAYNIKGAAAIAHPYTSDGTSQLREKWYSFKVNRDAEVMIFSRADWKAYTQGLPETETGWIDIEGAEGTLKFGGTVSSVGPLSVKRVADGDTVTVYSPDQPNNLFYVIVKPVE